MKTQNTPLNKKEELFFNCWITGKAQSIEDSQQTGSLETLCTKKKRLFAESQSRCLLGIMTFSGGEEANCVGFTHEAIPYLPNLALDSAFML